MTMKRETVTVERLYKEYGAELGLKLVASRRGMGRVIPEPTINRPGLLLAGFKPAIYAEALKTTV